MFDWDQGAVKAAKLITGSKKIALAGAYGLCIWKMAPHVANWLSIKAHYVASWIY